MTKGRPIDKDTTYRIIVHTNGGHRYAATKTFKIDENGRKTYRQESMSRVFCRV